MKILIGTPTAGGIAKIEYSRSVLNVANAVRAAGGETELFTFDGPDLVIARNLIAHLFLQDDSLTHLFSLDSDIDVSQSVVEKMIRLDAPFTSGVYTERNMDLATFAKAMTESGDARQATALAAPFTSTVERGALKVSQGFCALKLTTLGCSLVRRSVFTDIDRIGVEPFVCSKLSRHGIHGEMRNYFKEVMLPDGNLMSEDYSFCTRAHEAGVPITGYVGPGIAHIGAFRYEGPFIERLRTGHVS